MRRSRSSLTAWPAFADLMTILAVVSLAIAAAALGGLGAPQPIEELLGRIAKLEKENAQLTMENKDLQESLGIRDTRIEELEKRIEELKPVGHTPCLTHLESPKTPVKLLKIVVNSGYVLTDLWGEEHERYNQNYVGDFEHVGELFRVAIAQGPMNTQDFKNHANKIYQYGAATHTFGSPCRFFVELKKGTGSLASFEEAYWVAQRYFLFSNSTEIIQIMMRTRSSAGQN